MYLVQEYIDGETLDQELLREVPFSPQKIRDLLNDILNTLQFVHQHNIIHRDIKPDNIIRRRHDSKLVLIDFGIAKSLTNATTWHQGTMVGSFGYVPSEQMQGKVYPSSDLYSLGATCFHLLTGVHPWDLWKTQGYGWTKNWRQHWQSPAKAEPLISKQIGEILDRLLIEDFTQRCQSVEVILNVLNPRPTSSRSLVSPLPSIPSSSPQKSNPSKLQSPQTTTKTPSVVPSKTQPSRPMPSNFWASKFKRRLVFISVLVVLFLVGFRYCRPRSQPDVRSADKSQQNSAGTHQLTSDTAKSITYPKLELATTLAGGASVDALAISPDDKTLVSGNRKGTLKVWDLDTGNLKATRTVHFGKVTSLAISSDGKTLISGSDDRTIKIWDLDAVSVKKTLSDPVPTPVSSLDISPNGKILISGGHAYSNDTLKIWDLATGELKKKLYPDREFVYSVTFEPTGQSIIFGVRGQLKRLSLNTWEIQALPINLPHAAVSKDGQMLVGWNSSIISIFDLSTNQLQNTFTSHTSDILSVVISPDGKTIVSSEQDKAIKVWDLDKGELIKTLTGHAGAVNAVEITSDGQTLVSGSADRTIKIWRVP